MNAVIEIDEVRKIVHACPSDRLARPPALADRLEIGAVRPDLRMAIHTGLGRRDACIGELLDSRMTVTAVDAVISDVMFVTELNGLFPGEICLCVVRGPVEFEQKPDDYCDEENRAEDANFRNEVGTSMKDLTHRFAKSRLELEKTSRLATDRLPPPVFHLAQMTGYFRLRRRAAAGLHIYCSALYSWFAHLLSSADMRGVANAIDSASAIDTSQRRLMF